MSDVTVKVDVGPVLRGLDRLDKVGRRHVDDELRSIAGQAANEARARSGSATVAGLIGVRGREMSYGVVVYRRDAHDLLGNWLNYGTLGKRRPAAKQPGRKYSHAAGTGTRGRRFLRRPVKARMLERVLLAVRRAAIESGFEVR